MDIVRPAIAGTLESSDAQVTVEPGNGTVELSIERLPGNCRKRRRKCRFFHGKLRDQPVWKPDP